MAGKKSLGVNHLCDWTPNASSPSSHSQVLWIGMSASKKLINDPSSIVEESVQGLLLSDPRLVRIEGLHVILRYVGLVVGLIPTSLDSKRTSFF